MKFIDMFCGMGTVRMGFEKAGHECVYSIEWDKHKRKIYEVIFGNEPESKDITTVRASDLPVSDCWAFGAPCQDFSIAGTRAGLEGDRSSLVKEVFRLVRETQEEHRPEWLFYENVKGMLSSNKGIDYLEILFEMASLGYDIEFQLLNSKNFGVPQNRERVFTLGHLRSKGVRKVFPISGEVNSADCKQFSDGTGIAFCLDTGYDKGISPGYVNKGRRTQVIQLWNVMPISGVAYKGTGSRPYRIRRFTPRECMRLQGVSDEVTDMLIAKKISDKQMYRAAGDACTVNVIYEIARRL